VGGFDAKFKLVLLLGHAFGTLVDPEEIFHLGIDRLGKLELDYAKEKSLKVKLVAVAKRHGNGKISSLVMPKFVSPEDPLFGVDDVFNGVKTKTHFSDAQFFSGRGAGAYPTASAVISDISALIYDYKYEYKKRQFLTPAVLNQIVAVKLLFRYQGLSQSFVVEQFISVSETFQSESESYIIGTIDTTHLKLLLNSPLDQASAVLFEIKDDAIFEKSAQTLKY
jgi:homoserine dehydrogenase